MSQEFIFSFFKKKQKKHYNKQSELNKGQMF